jgi:hypothetical protein
MTAVDARLFVKADALLSQKAGKIKVEVSTPVTFEFLDADHQLIVRPVCVVSFYGPGRVQQLRVTVDYEVVYDMATGEKLSRECLDEFSRHNGVHNAWPYFRETVQSVMCHMGLPPFTLPLHKVSLKKDPKEVEHDAPREITTEAGKAEISDNGH